MSELNFPKNPVVGQEYPFNGLLYMFDGVKWITKGTGYNPVQDLYEMLASDAGASFVGANGYDNVQAALENLSATYIVEVIETTATLPTSELWDGRSVKVRALHKTLTYYTYGSAGWYDESGAKVV